MPNSPILPDYGQSQSQSQSLPASQYPSGISGTDPFIDFAPVGEPAPPAFHGESQKSVGVADNADWTPQRYRLDRGGYDEMYRPSGEYRTRWVGFLDSLKRLGMPEVSRRWTEARNLIRENGVTYNVYGEQHGLDRPWRLDPIPVIYTDREWESIETGLIQRATLLERILADLHGPQTLLQRGSIPPELVFNYPGYLRPCHRLPLPAGRYLYLYAADIARMPDGSFCVMQDRTQAPSGTGYALENRIVLSRMLPEAFRECRVQRLARFFQTLRDTLRSVAPRNHDNPRIVLLTPGPHNETYFEHAYLARYLGYTLAEGGDLTVRDNRVCLKLLGGLQPVDVILRRLDADYCDPLELRADSFLGIAGLVQAVRSGNVTIANALGSGLVENPALQAFLPGLCRHLLGEELLLASAPAWWCGDPASLRHVVANLHRMVVKPTFLRTRTEPYFGEKLSSAERESLIARIVASPGSWVAQEQLQLATTPVLQREQLEPRHVVTRAYLCAADDTFVVMPGGLSRVTGTSESLVVSMQQGGGSKDTWVLSPTAVSPFSLLRTDAQPVELSRAGGDLPSRAADNLYWLGRYAERAESGIRLIRSIFLRLSDRTGAGDAPELPILLRALTMQMLTAPGFVGEGSEARIAAPEEELLSLLFDNERVGSLAYTLDGLVRVAGSTRDRISQDMWRIIGSLDLRNESHRAFSARKKRDNRRVFLEVLESLNRGITTISAFGGLVMDSMTRGQGWRFLEMGRRLERSIQTITLLENTLVHPISGDVSLLETLLDIADSSMTYRRRYMSSVQAAPVVDLLLADETNPRSVAFQYLKLMEAVENLPHDSMHPARAPEQRIVLAGLTALRLSDIDELSATSGKHHTREALRKLLTQLGEDLPKLSETITRRFLSHLQLSRQLEPRRGVEE